ncbi:MAG: glycoside hydrolase family 3 C-terminal domain-containing protein [Flavobacteriales bacterium]|nr:glycoside hydrolase family 3 C-terminal domain-containing protein [Flavobacteriales bacterium]
MTLEEKFRQLFMVVGEVGPDSARYANGIFGLQLDRGTNAQTATQQVIGHAQGTAGAPLLERINASQRYFRERTRLGIPFIPYEEALHGLVLPGATAFPQSIALAASFDTTLMGRVSTAIALETRARGIRMVLSPVVNLATDVRWGRVEETYGEDPLLASWMGVAYVKALESRGIITTPKHFVANHGDGGRDSYPAFHSERLLRETHLKPFEACAKLGGARSLMTAYNSLNGRPCSANSWLLNDVLRKDWGFRGFVISDAAATGGANVLHFTAKDYADAGRQSVENGQDVIFQTDLAHEALFIPPYLDGSAKQAAIDSAVARVLRMKFELGLFDRPYADDSLLRALDMHAHRELAYEAAVKSAVLLKNRNRTLPLPKNAPSILVIGEEAREARLGGYSGPGNRPVSIWDAMEGRVHWVGRLSWTKGCGRSSVRYPTVPDSVLFHSEGAISKPGLLGTYYDGIDLDATPAFTRTDGTIDFQWTLFGPDPRVAYDHFGVRWEGTIMPKESGVFNIGVEGNDGYRLWLDGELYIDRWEEQGHGTTVMPFLFTKGQATALRIEYRERAGNARFRLVWDAGLDGARDERSIGEAVELARKHDRVIIVAGIEEGEFRDRSSLKLPGRQEELIKRVASTGRSVTVVLVGGSAITMDNWIDEVDAVLMAWYPGEAGGLAIADLLLGTRNPSGRLPMTFPRNEGQLPLVYNHHPTGRGDDYVDGTGQPLFPFGYGLSYTSFTYSDLLISDSTFTAKDTVHISFTVTNTGEVDGEEVVQLYVRDELASVTRPVKELKDFQRVKLAGGASQRVTFHLTAERLSMLNEALVEVTEPGAFRLMIGGSSKDIRLRTVIELAP